MSLGRVSESAFGRGIGEGSENGQARAGSESAQFPSGMVSESAFGRGSQHGGATVGRGRGERPTP